MKLIKLFPILLLTFSCSAQKNKGSYITDYDGIAIEKKDATKKYDEIYNDNNAIYTVGKKLKYSYFYQNIKGEKFLIRRGKETVQPQGYSTYDWEFVGVGKQDNETVSHIISLAISGNPFEEDNPEYNQTGISYDYVMNNGKSLTRELTGGIENKSNVWIHPPRNSFFKILELNPFPYIKAPYKVGTKWDWKLKISDHWADKRWMEWKDGIENIYNYEIIDKKNISTKFGNLECYVVKANAKSRIGQTELISYFHPKFGFIKLEYKNIDETKTVLELENIE